MICLYIWHKFVDVTSNVSILKKIQNVNFMIVLINSHDSVKIHHNVMSSLYHDIITEKAPVTTQKIILLREKK